MEEEEQDVFAVDDGMHTVDNPYCEDLRCWCHTDVVYHDSVQHPVYLGDEVEQAYSFYGVAHW